MKFALDESDSELSLVFTPEEILEITFSAITRKPLMWEGKDESLDEKYVIKIRVEVEN